MMNMKWPYNPSQIDGQQHLPGRQVRPQVLAIGQIEECPDLYIAETKQPLHKSVGTT